MYFAAGSARCISLADSDLNTIGPLPKESSSTEDGAIIALRETIDGNFFAALSIRAVYLWSTNPPVAISKLYRSSEDIHDFGENVNLFWKPDSTVLAVTTNEKFVLFYRILALPTKIFQYEFAKPHHYQLGVAEGIGLYQASMMFTSAFHSENQVWSVTFWNSLIFISTRNASSMISIDASNLEILHKEKISLKDIQGLNDIDDSIYVSEMLVLEPHGCLLWLLSNGQLYLAIRNKPLGWGDHSKESTNLLCFTWYCIPLDYPTKIVCMAFNARFSILATGLLSGAHTLFYLNDNNIHDLIQGKVPFQSDSKSSWFTFISEIVHFSSKPSKAEISSMTWSYDGQALAIGFYHDGFCVFSTFGTLILLATKHSLQSIVSGNKQLLDIQYLSGISYMFWAPSSYYLCLLSSKAKFQVESSVLHCVPFMRSIAATNPIPDNYAHSVLIGSETMLILSESPLENNQRPMRLKYIHLPNLYMAENWPIDIAAISPLGRYVAIGGVRGFALYSRNSATWKLFRNPLQENSFICKGILFLNEFLAILAQLENEAYMVWIFDCERNLDLGLALASFPISEKPVLMTKFFGSIYLLLQSGMILQLQLQYNGKDSLTLFSNETWNLPPPLLPSKVTCLTRTCSVTPSFVCLYCGDVYRFTTEPSQSSIIDSQVECLFSTELLHSDFGESVWLSSKGECHITSVNGARIVVPLDFTPLSLSSKKGYLLGLTPQFVIKKGFDMLTYTLNSKTCLYLHHVLEYFLKQKMTQAAHEFSGNFRHLGYFSHALEMLLHCVWEREAETQATVAQTALLPEVVAFIKQFDQFLDIIVNCARKTELALWDYLFSFIDSPQVLFDQCLERNQLHTATSFLVIVHNMGPDRLSGKESIRLLEKLLQNENFELSRDLVRFLRSIGGKGTSIKLWESLNRNMSDETKIQSVSSGLSEFSISYNHHQQDSMPYFELLVSKHASHLISSFRIRSLLSMSRSLDFPLSIWLSKERHRHAKLEAHFDALQQLHIQFDWPYPLTMPGNLSPSSSLQNFSRRHSLTEVVTDFNYTSSNSLRSRRAISFIETGFSDLLRSRSDAVKDLQTLAKLTMEAECFGWAFLLYSMLGNSDSIVRAVVEKQNLEEWSAVVSALLRTEAVGYQLWIEEVDRKLQDSLSSSTEYREEL